MRVLATYGNVHRDGTSACGDAMIPHPRSSEHYARVERERLWGEPFLSYLGPVGIEGQALSGSSDVILIDFPAIGEWVAHPTQASSVTFALDAG